MLCVFGWQIARAAGFAIGFLYFALPGWDLLAPALQHLTAWAIGVAGPAVGLPVAVSGTTVFLPGGATFAVERPCSGVDFLTVGLAVVTLHGELERASFRRRAGLIGGMFLLAILSNWVRVILIVAVGYVSHMQSALATSDHVAFGWVVFACALLLFVWAAGRRRTAEPDAPVTGAPATADRGYAVWHHSVIATALLAVPTLVYISLLTTRAAPVGAAVFELPLGRTPWQGPSGSVDPLWQPEFVGTHAEQRARYQRTDGRIVEVVAIGFPRQTQGAHILDYRNSLLGDRGLATQAVTLIRSAGIPHSEVIVIGPDGRRSLIWSVIDIGGTLFGEPLYSQLWYGALALIGTPYSALFALKAQCAGSCDAARAALADFLRFNGSALFASLPHAVLEGQEQPRRPRSAGAAGDHSPVPDVSPSMLRLSY